MSLTTTTTHIVASALDIPDLKISSTPAEIVQFTEFQGLHDQFLNLKIGPSSIDSCSGSSPTTSRNSSFYDDVVPELEALRSVSGSSSSVSAKYICGYPPCQEETQMICDGCGQKSYCTREHQELDWAHHQKECKIRLFWHEIDPKFGWKVRLNYDVSEQVTLVKNEEPFVIIPSMPTSKEAPICINCGVVLKRTVPEHFHPTRDPATCLVCKWPMCEGGCTFAGEDNCINMHSVQECMTLQVARQSEFVWNGQPVAYQYLWILRIALIKKRNPREFEKMLLLANFTGEDSDRRYLNDATKKFLSRFLPNIQRLLSDLELEKIFKIIIVKFRPMHFLTCSPVQKKLQALYFESSIISHSCVANLQYFTDESYRQSLVSVRPIQAGELLTINFIQELILRPTTERRNSLLKRFNIWCNCERCEDPSEFGTNFSNPPCRAKGNCSEYSKDVLYEGPLDLDPDFWIPNYCLHPVDPKDMSKGWYCPNQKCKSAVFRDVDVKYPIESFLHKIHMNRNNYLELGRILGNVVENKIMHCTHYAVFEASFKLLELVSDLVVTSMGIEFLRGGFYLQYLLAAECVHNVFVSFVPHGLRLDNYVMRLASIIKLAGLTDELRCRSVTLAEVEGRLKTIYNTLEPIDLENFKKFRMGIPEIQDLRKGETKFDQVERLGIQQFLDRVERYVNRKTVISRFMDKFDGLTGKPLGAHKINNGVAKGSQGSQALRNR